EAEACHNAPARSTVCRAPAESPVEDEVARYQSLNLGAPIASLDESVPERREPALAPRGTALAGLAGFEQDRPQASRAERRGGAVEHLLLAPGHVEPEQRRRRQSKARHADIERGREHSLADRGRPSAERTGRAQRMERRSGLQAVYVEQLEPFVIRK